MKMNFAVQLVHNYTEAHSSVKVEPIAGDDESALSQLDHEVGRNQRTNSVTDIQPVSALNHSQMNSFAIYLNMSLETIITLAAYPT